ncbi:hypothetical protein [Pseudomonas sp. SID14000]|uniref:hypothetical protein n=1 Tax=Pseudomonas sp. SID14000 TaxID=1986221 RepID=UPI000B3D284B|nr:hypothetical protein [Pseudomonas sp. SID14000]
MFAIHARYMPQTRTKGARLKLAGAVTERVFQYDEKLSLDENLKNAFRIYASLECWVGAWSYGQLPDGSWVATCATFERDTFSVGQATMAERLHQVWTREL